MNKEQFILGIKITIFISIVTLIIIIGILLYVFNSKKANPDFYSELLSSADTETSNIDVAEISLEAKGIDKEEFENYLSMFSHLFYEGYYKDYELTQEELKDTQNMNMAIDFLDILYLYEGEKDEQGIIAYEVEKVNNIVKEMTGTYIYKKLDVKNIYSYDETKNVYIPNLQDNINTLLISMDELEKKDEKIEVIYKVAFAKESEKQKYLEGQKVELETYNIKATILENKDYEFSKYYVSSIKQISKELVKYN